MSLLLGMINVHGEPIDPTAYAALCNTLKHYPHAAVRQQTCDGAAISCWLTLNTPPALNELDDGDLRAAAESDLLFAATGRIDNRDEVAHALGCAINDSVSDTQLMRASYLRWREDAASRLSGDWAFAAFHPRERKLLLVRDPHGYTSMHYHFNGRTLIFCSVIDPLLVLAQKSLHVNTELLISQQMLSKFGSVDASHTWYRDLFRLPPAHMLTLDGAKLDTRRHWHPETLTALSYADVKTCAAELRSLMDSAVAARLRSHGPVASMLSGGLDSGTVTCLAAAQLRDRGQSLKTYSHVPLHAPSKALTSRRIGNEKPYMEAVVAAMGNIDPHYLDSGTVSPLSGILRMLDIVKEPIYGAGNLYWLYDIYASAARESATALLTGENGNATISFSGLDYLLGWQRLLRQQGLLRTIKKKLLRPALQSASQLLHERRRIPSFAYLKPGLLRHYEPTTGHDLNRNFASSRDFALGILMPGENPRCYLGGVLSQHFGLELRDPTADRRVVEYCLSIPNDVFFDENGQGKNLLRTMMAGTLPQMTLSARGKGLQSADLGLRLASCSAGIDSVMQHIGNCAAVDELMDTAAMQRSWHIIKNTVNNNYNVHDAHHFLRALMVSIFIHNVHNPASAIREEQ